MRVGRIRVATPDGPQPLVVALRDGRREVIDVRGAERLRLERSGATVAAAARLARALVPASMTAALEGGPAFIEALHRAGADASGDATLTLGDVDVIAPLDPPSFRDFMAFAEHFERASALRGRCPPAVLYELPVSYLGSTDTLLAPEDEVPWPSYSEHLDYELELGIVIGRAGRDLTPGAAADHVFGFTVVNDFSARDIQMREMGGGLGPAKGKHFGSAIGPWIVTADAVAVDELAMAARVNGETWSTGSPSSLLWSVGELVAWASAAEALPVGALLGTGTVGGGCGLELERELAPGDVVELEIAGIGVLRNRVGAPGPQGWTPTARGGDRPPG